MTVYSEFLPESRDPKQWSPAPTWTRAGVRGSLPTKPPPQQWTAQLSTGQRAKALDLSKSVPDSSSLLQEPVVGSCTNGLTALFPHMQTTAKNACLRYENSLVILITMLIVINHPQWAGKCSRRSPSPGGKLSASPQYTGRETQRRLGPSPRLLSDPVTLSWFLNPDLSKMFVLSVGQS